MVRRLTATVCELQKLAWRTSRARRRRSGSTGPRHSLPPMRAGSRLRAKASAASVLRGNWARKSSSLASRPGVLHDPIEARCVLRAGLVSRA